jgi:16S rRNA (guanine527-N7)-methyltransferase
MELVHFAEELSRILPGSIPNRERLIAIAAEHLKLICAANEHINLTRITDAREAAIKHVWDSVAPWELFWDAKRVIDAGTGAGFPGIPLAVVLPHVRFILVESVQKRARFVDAAVEALELPNVHVLPERAEAVAMSQRVDVITARAIAPVGKIAHLFGPVLKNGTRLLLYKGPDVDTELTEATHYKLHATVLQRYELPEGMGRRTVVELRSHRGAAHGSNGQ